MFHSARIKLTAWYLIIIMLISLSFSGVIYRLLGLELDRVERMQRQRNQRQLIIPLPDIGYDGQDMLRRVVIDPELVAETKHRLLVMLLGINFGIFALSAVVGYLLAGRTLDPIRQMVDEQDRFISDASHELRTPLTTLKTEIEVNLRDKQMGLAQAKNLLSSNLEEVNNLQLLSNNLISLARYQRVNHFKVEKISLSSIVTEAIKKVATIAKTRKVTIVNKVKDISFYGEKQSLTEMMVIFLDNAIKYSPVKSEVVLTSRIDKDSLVIQVIDQGMGIKDGDIPHLFDRFYRADQSRCKTDITGYGLGLSIAKQIIDRHRGLVQVTSQVGQGSVFTVRLPLNPKNKITKNI